MALGARCTGAIFGFILAASAHACSKETFGVVIDVGHSAKSPGAVSARGTPEWRFNHNLASLLAEELRSSGFQKVFLSSAVRSDLSLLERAERANRLNAKLFLSIHHDSVQKRYLTDWTHDGRRLAYSDVFSGYSLFYSGRNGDPKGSLRFARLVGTELRRSCLTPSLHHAERIPGEGRDLVDEQRGIFRFDDLVVLRSTKMPAILIEAGLIVNRSEEIRLTDPAYQKLLADSIVRAINRFCQKPSGAGTAVEAKGLEETVAGAGESCPPDLPAKAERRLRFRKPL